jgi:hypothetical protein
MSERDLSDPVNALNRIIRVGNKLPTTTRQTGDLRSIIAESSDAFREPSNTADVILVVSFKKHKVGIWSRLLQLFKNGLGSPEFIVKGMIYFYLKSGCRVCVEYVATEDQLMRLVGPNSVNDRIQACPIVVGHMKIAKE